MGLFYYFPMSLLSAESLFSQRVTYFLQLSWGRISFSKQWGFLAYYNFFKIHNVSPQNKSLKAMQAEFKMNLPHDNFGQNGFSFQHNIILPV